MSEDHVAVLKELEAWLRSDGTDKGNVTYQACADSLAALLAERELADIKRDIMCDLAYAHGVQAGQIIPDGDQPAKDTLRRAMERRVSEALRARSTLPAPPHPEE